MWRISSKSLRSMPLYVCFGMAVPATTTASVSAPLIGGFAAFLS